MFSHSDKYMRAKLSAGDQGDKGLTTVHHVHSVVGSTTHKWVLGLLSQREDAHYYLEDSTLTVKVSFTELEYADPDALFTENCILLCCGLYHNETFYLTKIMHPPLHARKSFIFKLNEQDYFGSYIK